MEMKASIKDTANYSAMRPFSEPIPAKGSAVFYRLLVPLQ